MITRFLFPLAAALLATTASAQWSCVAVCGACWVSGTGDVLIDAAAPLTLARATATDPANALDMALEQCPAVRHDFSRCLGVQNQAPEGRLRLVSTVNDACVHL